MKLNDFLTMELDGRGVVDANRDVLMEEFLKNPKKYICDAGVLGEIQASGHYLSMKRAVRDEMVFDEDMRNLDENGVHKLLKWLLAAAEVKASVHDVAKGFLGVAVEEARDPTTSSAPIYLKGCSESVYNAGWHCVVEVLAARGREWKRGMGNHRIHGLTRQLA
ncbi:putative retrotransposon hot spot protein (RHS) [Trypanosoma cruzi]|uniref:Putative retrotransposon hot spot protein (RHS) n=1 Tax=Trypanosoma cruzi TaxID=5693 RepID=A0A2V2WWW1_TRYCR|nr:putative retrotransposon hot spot protein (RHS) [Trypanosoma cruzi]